MAFQLTPRGLHWGWGAGLGVGASVLSRYALTSQTIQQMIPGDQSTRGRNIVVGSVLTPVVVGGVMMIWPRTRTAGLATAGAGVATGLAMYALDQAGVLPTALHGDVEVLGLVAAQKALAGAPVQVLSGGGGLGLPVASEVSGAPVEVLSGGGRGSFGTSFGHRLGRR